MQSSFPPLPDRPEEIENQNQPEKERDDEELLSPNVYKIMLVAIEQELLSAEYLQVARECIAIVHANLFDTLEQDETSYTDAMAATLEMGKLESALAVLDNVDITDEIEDEEEGDENE